MTRSVDEVAARLEAKARRDNEAAEAERTRRRRTRKQSLATEQAFTAVKEGRSPDIDACPDLGVVMMPDPGDDADVRSGRRTNAIARPKLTSLRGDPVGLMHRRNQLGDGEMADIRLSAARHLQALYEAAEIGGARGIDPSKPLIQTSGVVEQDTDRRLVAVRHIERVEKRLRKREGERGDELVRMTLWHKQTLSQIAERDGGGRKEIEYLGERLRKCLDVVAAELGYVASNSRGRQPRRRRRDKHAEVAADLDAFAGNPVLYAAVHRAKRTA